MSNDDLTEATQAAFFLAGPTAVGKTEVALAVAEACNGEIVGADAFQVYRGLDLLTAKPPQESLARVPHHLVGSVPLAEAFNVARYLEAAQAAIADIRRRGRLASPELRAELASTPLPQLLERLETRDPEAAAAIDTKNPRRVLRALEICLVTGKPFSSFRQEWEKQPHFHGVLLERTREELYERIDRRTHAMFEEGVVEEVRAALAGGGVGSTAEQVIGWREITALLRSELTEADAIAAIQQTTRRYAKRQLTWFHREPLFVPISLSGENGIAAILERAAVATR